MSKPDYLYVANSHAVTATWHRVPSSTREWALCGLPPKGDYWRQAANEIEGLRQCRQCKKIAKTLNQMGVNRV